MNMAYNHYNDQEFVYETATSRSDKAKPQRSRRADYSQSSNRPSSYNGMHRRRNKRHFA